MDDLFREYASDARAISEAASSRAVALAVEVCERAPDDEHLLAIHHGESVAAAGALLADTDEQLHFAVLESDDPLTVVIS